MADTKRRVALLNEAGGYVGPAMAREWARRGHDLVVGNPAEGLVDELTALGAEVVVVDDVRNLAKPEAAPALVAAALERFGRIDAAAAFTGQIIGGRFTKSSIEDLRTLVVGCLEAPYNFLRAVTEPMIAQGMDELVLACTHYPLVRPLIERICGEGVEVIDPAPAVARQVKRVLGEAELLAAEGGGGFQLWTSRITDELPVVLDLLGLPKDGVAPAEWQGGTLSLP